MKRRIAAATATAALVAASPAAATRQGQHSANAPAGAGKPRVTRIAAAAGVADRLSAMRAVEGREHRHRLASLIAAELPDHDSAKVERGLSEAHPGELSIALARTTGATPDQIDAAFESMARHALERRRA